MDPATRSLVRIDVDQAAIADQILAKLMGDDVEAQTPLDSAERQGRPLPRHLAVPFPDPATSRISWT